MTPTFQVNWTKGSYSVGPEEDAPSHPTCSREKDCDCTKVGGEKEQSVRHTALPGPVPGLHWMGAI